MSRFFSTSVTIETEDVVEATYVTAANLNQYRVRVDDVFIWFEDPAKFRELYEKMGQVLLDLELKNHPDHVFAQEATDAQAQTTL